MMLRHHGAARATDRQLRDASNILLLSMYNQVNWDTVAVEELFGIQD
jgi:hypothetical protein